MADLSPPYKGYLPSAEELLRAWFLRFDTNIDDAAGPLALTPEIVAALKAQGSAAMASIDTLLTSKAAYLSDVAAKNAAVGSAKTFFRNEITIIKKLPGYTEAIGESLGLIPAVTPFDPTNYQAKITSAVNFASGGHVRLRFSKANGNIDGVNMYSQLAGQTAWNLLGFKMLTPYIDDTPLAQPGVPEIRLYRCVGVIGDVEIGFASDPVQVTVS